MIVRVQRFVPAFLLSFLAHGALLLVLWHLPAPPAAPDDSLDDPAELGLSLTLASASLHRSAFPAPEEVHLLPLPAPPPTLPVLPAPSSGSADARPGQSEVDPTRGVAGSVGVPGTGGNGSLLSPLVRGAGSVVFVLDRSVSMGPSGALARARRELASCLRSLPVGTRFQVIAYNKASEPLLPAGSGQLVPARPDAIALALARLEDLLPAGATDHARALRGALLLRPAAVVLFTDADDLLSQDVLALTRLNAGRTVVHVVELNAARDRGVSLLRQLAEDNGGSYRRVVP